MKWRTIWKKSLLLLLTFTLLGILRLPSAVVYAEPVTEEEGTTAFLLRQENPLSFPLLKGDLGFRLFGKSGAQKQSESTTAKEEQKEAPKTKDDAYPQTLCLGGNTFGVRLLTEGVLVVSVNETEPIHPAYDAGIRPADMIVKMNNQPIKRVDDVGKVLSECGGNAVEVTCIRGGKRECFTLVPHYEKENDTYKAGIWIRDSLSGIGTVTYYHPETGEFGGLGHGICDIDTGALVPIAGGMVLDVSVTEIVKGEAGKPGELRGFLKHQKKGSLQKNCECGVFGILFPIPENGKRVEVAKAGEIHVGKATIVTALEGEAPQEYEIKITEIHTDAKTSKCFSITVTDPTLSAKTGGIVQGMSGSPIIQNGKLVGAVTHVLVGDPTRGYGIFIENMLNASHMARNELPTA